MAKRRIPLLDRVLVAKAVPPSKASAELLLPEKITKCDYGVVGTEVCDKNGNLNPVKNGYPLLVSKDHGWTELKLRDKRSNRIGFPTLSKSVGSGSLKHGERLYSEGSNISSISIQLKSYTRGPISLRPVLQSRYLSSQAGANSGDKEDDLEDGFSGLEVPLESVDSVDGACKEDDEELISEEELSEEYDESAVSSLDLVDVEASERGAKKVRLRLSHSPIFQIIMKTPRNSLTRALDKYVEEGKPLERYEIYLAMYNLRQRRVYPMALQFVECLEASKKIELVERDYASHLDLIAKVNGLLQAEKYIDKIPESFRSEVVYGALLANYVAAVNVKKAEEVFDKIIDLRLPITAFACNQLLLLYKRVDWKKIADVLFMMEKENIKPTLFTYKMLVDVKGRTHDISGMEQILETMKSEGVEPDLLIKSLVAKAYIFSGLNEKAEATLKEIAGNSVLENRYLCKVQQNRNVFKVLLPLYAALGKADDVARIWKVCNTKPYLGGCIAAIVAWGKLGQIEKAEEVFKKMVKTWKFSSKKYYGAMLKVYANHKLWAKGKELVNRMSESRYRNGAFNWNALVKFYVESGEVEKADLVLHEAFQQSKIRPLYGSFITVMNQYAKRGDIHNAEKIFHMLKEFGYASRVKQYQSLLQTYVNAKTPAYGFLERMKADNMFPNKAMSAQLMANDALRKSLITKLLDSSR